MNSILMPLFLYPVMLWVMLTALVFVTGLSERTSSRLVILDVPSAHVVLMDTLQARTSLEIREDVISADSAATLIRVGELDAVVEFLPPEADARGMDDNFQVLIRYDRAVDRSRRARDRVESIVAGYRSRWVEREASALDISDADQQQFRILQDNVSSGQEMGALVMGILIPLFLVLMVAMGCLVPSIDSTAGERERSTWETLMTVSASRLSVVTAKYLYVATLGILAGVLLGFVRALGEFGATIIVAGNIPGRTQTLRLAMFFDIQLGHNDDAIRLVAISIALAVAALLVHNWLLKRAAAPEPS